MTVARGIYSTIIRIEVYNEEINDLLQQGAVNLRILSEDPVKGAVIERLIEELVHTPQELLEVLQRGEANRSYGETKMNAESSRSHTIYRLVIEVNSIDTDENTGKRIIASQRTSYLNLVDLAGSERQKSTGASGKTLKEGANINKSLLALGAVINKLVESSKGGKPPFIPYRDSKLTRILKQSLGGNTYTSILCTCTGAGMHREETVSTLKFGQLCKSIKNSVKSNEVVDDRTLMKQLKATVAAYKQKLVDNGISVDDKDAVAGAVDAGAGDGGALVAKLKKEKAEQAEKLRALEAMLSGGMGDMSAMLEKGEGVECEGGTPAVEGTPEIVNEDGSITPAVVAQPAIPAQNNMMNKFMSMQKIKDENHSLTDQVHFLEQEVGRLQTFADDAAYLEDSKQAFEEYQRHAQQELEDERTKVDKEKTTLTEDRGVMLIERGNLAEKESRLGNLMSTLDERESKLRQYMLTLKDQQEQWQRSVADLQRREDLVEDWSRNHSAKEKKIEDLQHQHERKVAALREREEAIISAEMEGKSILKDIADKEARLQTQRDKLTLSENALFAQEEKNAVVEAAFRKRETECDMKERELTSRRREMESWDSLLREKDRKVSVEQRTLDEKEDNVRQTEEKLRLRELELERKIIDLKQRETDVATQGAFYNNTLHTIELRETKSLEQSRKLRVWEEDLTAKDVELHAWEAELLEMQEKLADLSIREEELEVKSEAFRIKEDEFYNVKAAQISARHTKEITRLQNMLSEQLRAGENFQHELDKSKAEVTRKSQELEAAEEALKGKDELLDMLRGDLEQVRGNLATEKKQRRKRQLLSKRGRRKGRGAVPGDETTETEGDGLGSRGSNSGNSSSSDSYYSSSSSDSSSDSSEEEREDPLLTNAADIANSPIKGSTGGSGSGALDNALDGSADGAKSKPKAEEGGADADGTEGSSSSPRLKRSGSPTVGGDGGGDPATPSGTSVGGTESVGEAGADATSVGGEDKEAEALRTKMEEATREKLVDAEDSGENILDQPNVLLEAVSIQRILHRILKYHNAVPDWTPEYPAHHRERRSASDIYADNSEYIAASTTTGGTIIQREAANRHWMQSGSGDEDGVHICDGEEGHGRRHGHRHGHSPHHPEDEHHSSLAQQQQQAHDLTRTGVRKVNKSLVEDYYKKSNSGAAAGGAGGGGSATAGDLAVGAVASMSAQNMGLSTLTRTNTHTGMMGLTRTSTGINMAGSKGAAHAGGTDAHPHAHAHALGTQSHAPVAAHVQHTHQHQQAQAQVHPYPGAHTGSTRGSPVSQVLLQGGSQFPGANHRRLPPGVHTAGGVNMGVRPVASGSSRSVAPTVVPPQPGYMGSPNARRPASKPAVPSQRANPNHKAPARNPSMYSPNANVLIVHSNDTTNRTGAMKQKLAQGEYTIDLSHDQVKKARVAGKFVSPKSN